MARQIGKQRESALHSALKEWYRLPGDLLEADVDGFVIDILRGDKLVEIQTGNFSKIKSKLVRLLDTHTVHLVYPLAVLHWIVRVDKASGELLSRRRSPKRGDDLQIFDNLVYIAGLLSHPNLSVELLQIEDEIVYINDGLGSWRRKGWSILDRRLIKVINQKTLSYPDDYSTLVPSGLPDQFTVRQLAALSNQRIRLAQKLVYCLYQVQILERSGKTGRSWLYKHKQV